jgi:hypothetical protein
MTALHSHTAAQPPTSTTAPTFGRLDRSAVHTALRAAGYACAAYPGPIGELIDRELRGYVDSGYAVPTTALAHRLVVQLAAAHDRNRQASSATWSQLPARYRPGSPLQWDYGTPA